MIKDIIITLFVGLFWFLTTIFPTYTSVAISCWVAIISLFFLFFDNFLWICIPSFILRQYKIYGSYTGKLYYNYNKKKDNIKNVEVNINQTFLKSSIYLITDEIIGKSIVSKWNFSEDKLFYIYRTDPKSEFKDKNPIQYGGAQIKINPKDLKHIRIEYWTDRKTKGYMELNKK